MSTLSTAAIPEVPLEPKIYTCGTLRYTPTQLYQLFFWLMWNEFTFLMLENVNAFSSFIQIENHATFTQMGVFGTVSSIMTIWMNPFFSVWSDRTRTPWGRRRPFLVVACPPLALCILGIPYMPTLHHYLLRFPEAVAFFSHIPMNGAAFMVALCGLALGIFNQIMLALFSYLYWDVMPQEVLGRWTAFSKVVAAAGIFLWGFFFIGLAVHHMKALCDTMAAVCLVVYLVSVWKVKEGEYAKVDVHKKGGIFAPIRSYFVECYSDTFFLWVFGSFFVASIGNASNGFKDIYLRYTLHADYDIFGKINAAQQVVPIVLGFFVGTIADRLHPVKMFAPTFALWGLVNLGAFFFVHNQMTYLVWTCLIQAAIFLNGVTYGALLPAIYPREKFGQFCSANQLLSSVGGIFLGIPVGFLFDHLPDKRYAFLFSAVFLFAGSLLFLKVYKNYEERRGRIPVPHAG